jgi:hypothetical protein
LKKGWPPANQKTSITLRNGRWRHPAHAPDSKKFFAPLFFKKAAAFGMDEFPRDFRGGLA